MSQKKEKYARWKDDSVIQLQARVEALERRLTMTDGKMRRYQIELEQLQDDRAIERASQQHRRREELRRREQRRAAKAAWEEQQREVRRKRRAVLGFVLIVAGLLTVWLVSWAMSPAPETSQPVAPTAETLVERDYITQNLAAAPMAELKEETAGRYGEITGKERELLARLIWAEARGECPEGQQAVAEVVLNRVMADNFPNSVGEVIYEGQGTSCPQFSTAALIRQAQPGAAQYEAVERALHGENILPMDVVFFSRGAENDRVWGNIGNHVFCYQYIWM